MSTNHHVGAAVDAYRKVLRAELALQVAETELGQALARLNRMAGDDWRTYLDLTGDIDIAVSNVEEAADAAGWAMSTRMQRVKAAIAQYGRT